MKKLTLILLGYFAFLSILPTTGLAFDRKQNKPHHEAVDPFVDDPFFQSSSELMQQMRKTQKKIDQFMETQFSRMQTHFDHQPFGSDNNVQITEGNNEITYKIKLPKGTTSNVDATVRNNNLILSLDVTHKVTKEHNNSKVTSYSQSYYSQSFELPRGYDEKTMDTKIKDSNLIVKFKKIA